MVPVVAGGTAAPAAEHSLAQPEGAVGDPVRVCEFVGNMNGGGVESVVMNYYRHVDRSRVQFDLVVTDASTLVPREEVEALGGRVFTVPSYMNLRAFCEASYSLFAEHPEWRIVHSHMNSLNVFPLREAARAGVPVRISHSHSTGGRGEYVKNLAKTVLRTQANRYPTHRFACSKVAGRWLFGRAPFEVMYNAIELDRFRFDADARREVRRELRVPDNAFVVLHLGRFMEQKNHRFLLHSFRLLLDERPDAVLLLAGDGPLRGEVEELAARLGITSRVRFLGQRSDAGRLYSAADVFVLPSLYEGLGMVAVEAQASGLSCLLADTVTREVDVTGATRFLPIQDPRAWAHALAHTAPRTADQRLAHGASGAPTAFAHYDIARQGAWLTETYLRLDHQTRETGGVNVSQSHVAHPRTVEVA